MRLYKLNDTVLNLKGNAQKLLGGLTSNSLDKPLNAFLNLHGRIISTFRQQMISDDEVILIVPALAVQSLLAHLDRYAKLNGTKIQMSPLKAYLDLETGQLQLKEEDLPQAISEEEFTRYRLDQYLPVMG
ncbi:MAG: hypothetical protein HQL15_05045, partial [Candidatus Omnitrophica bacterium]|nr:hypothetical protein [Candidatus Omnitrophota bacterium]